jgi:hypothetical protein
MGLVPVVAGHPSSCSALLPMFHGIQSSLPASARYHLLVDLASTRLTDPETANLIHRRHIIPHIHFTLRTQHHELPVLPRWSERAVRKIAAWELSRSGALTRRRCHAVCLSQLDWRTSSLHYRGGVGTLLWKIRTN